MVSFHAILPLSKNIQFFLFVATFLVLLAHQYLDSASPHDLSFPWLCP